MQDGDRNYDFVINIFSPQKDIWQMKNMTFNLVRGNKASVVIYLLAAGFNLQNNNILDIVIMPRTQKPQRLDTTNITF